MPDQQSEAEVVSGKDVRPELPLEAVEQRLMLDLADKEREVERLRQEVLRVQSNGSNMLTKEEKEALKARIKDLITKISSHL